MEQLDKLQIAAKENLELAKKEKELAKKFNLTGISELKRAKVRKQLAEKNIKLNARRIDLAEKYEELLERKSQSINNEILEFSKKDIQFEKDYSHYIMLITDIQTQIAEIQLEMADLELDIASEKIKISHETEYAAKEREDLSKQQLAYIKAVSDKKSQNKISNLEEKYLLTQETLNQDRKDILEDLKTLKQKEVKLAELKKLHSLKLSEREKARPHKI
jgi:hypothetical protein